MSFAEWKKRSELFCTLTARLQSGRIGTYDLRDVCQAAYKSGERKGRKDADELHNELSKLINNK